MSAEPETDTETLPQFQAQLFELVHDLAEHDVSRDIWDEEPPALWIITGDVSPVGAVTLGTAEVPVAEHIWRAAPMGQVLGLLARSLGTPPPSLVRRVRAVMLATESWQLNPPESATEQEREEARDFCRLRGVADHPWGREVKAVFALDTERWTYYATRRRVDGEGTGYAVPPDGDRYVAGSLPAALDALLRTLTGGRS